MTKLIELKYTDRGNTEYAFVIPDIYSLSNRAELETIIERTKLQNAFTANDTPAFFYIWDTFEMMLSIFSRGMKQEDYIHLEEQTISNVIDIVMQWVDSSTNGE